MGCIDFSGQVIDNRDIDHPRFHSGPVQDDDIRTSDAVDSSVILLRKKISNLITNSVLQA